MQVVSKLVKMEFKIGRIAREGDQLVIVSDPNQPVKSKVYLSPTDVAGAIRAALSWSVISYLLAFPIIYFRWRRQPKPEA